VVCTIVNEAVEAIYGTGAEVSHMVATTRTRRRFGAAEKSPHTGVGRKRKTLR
jgi:hypothetical protein